MYVSCSLLSIVRLAYLVAFLGPASCSDGKKESAEIPDASCNTARDAISVVRATLVAKKRPAPGKQSGRQIDEILWEKLYSPTKAGTGAVKEFLNLSALVDEDAEEEVNIIDARGLVEQPQLEVNGVTLLNVPLPDELMSRNIDDGTAAGGYRSWAEDEELVQQFYYPSVAEAVRTATGASGVFPISHLVRSSLRSDFNSSEGPGGSESPMASSVHFVHADYTGSSFHEVLKMSARRGDIPLSVIEAYAQGRRVAICNVWRANLARQRVAQAAGFPKGVVLAAPLAILDTASLLPSMSDTFPWLLATGNPDPDAPSHGMVGHGTTLEHAPERHRWLYWSNQTDQEALLLYAWLRDADGTERASFHSAFDLPGTPIGDPKLERRSIETRCICVW